MQVASLDTVLRLNSTAFQQGMQAAATQANTSLKGIQAQAEKTASVLDTVRKSVTLWAELEIGKNVFDSLVGAQVQLQGISYTLLSATGNSTDAANAMTFLRSESDKIGLSLPQAADGFAKLSAAATASGVSMKDQKGLFDAFAKASTTLHLSAARSGRALLALQEMFSRGTIQSRQLNQQLGQAIPGSAARFKNAVMEMIQGTDLQGKSFDQLISKGKLVTSQFLPALQTALEGAGTGWKEASGSLNANLNRLQTSWFNLKTEVSGGLFTDIVNNGAAALAANLNSVASAISLVAGVAAARGVAALGQALASRVQTGYQKSYSGPAMSSSYTAERAATDAAQAEAMAQRASALALDNSLMVERASLSAEYQKDLQFELAGIQDVAAAEVRRIEVAQALNDALGTGVVAERTAVELAVKLEVAQTALAESTARLTASQVAYNAAAATGDLFSAKQAGLTAAAAEAQAAAALATKGSQEARVAEQAFSSLGSKIVGAGKSLGSFALSLVGGPWGAAALAIGAVGLAIYDVVKASQEYDQETTKQVQSLQDVTSRAEAAAKAYGDLQDGMTLPQALDVKSSADDQIKKTASEIEALKSTIEQLKASYGEDVAAGSGIMAQLDQDKLDAAKARLEALQENLSLAQKAAGDLGGQLNATLVPAVDGLRKAIDTLRGGGSILDAIKGLASPADVAAQVKVVTDARSQIGQLTNGAATLAEQEKKYLATHGKSHVVTVQYDMKVALGKAELLGLSPEKLSALKAQIHAAFAPALSGAASEDALKSGKKASQVAGEHARAAASLAAHLDQVNASLKEEFGLTSKINPEQAELAKLLAGTVPAYNNATAAQKASILATAESSAALEKEVKAREQATKDAKAYADAQNSILGIERQLSQQQQDQLAAIGQGAQETKDATAKLAIMRQFDALQRTADKQHTKGSITDSEYTKQTAYNREQLALQLQDYTAFTRARLTLEGNWVNGAKAAWMNYRDQAANMAANVESLVTSGLQGMTDALTAFATTGKANFRSMVASFLTDLVRLEAKILEVKALQAIGGAMSGSSVGWISSLGSALATSGGHAGGGSVQPGSMQQVGENGRPEVYQSQGNTYLLGGAGGTVTPLVGMGGGGAGGSGATPQINVTIQTVIQSDGSKTSQSKSSSNSNKLADQLAQELKGAVDKRLVEQSQPNGILWNLLRGQAA